MEWETGMRSMLGEMVSRKEAEQRVAKLEAENQRLREIVDEQREAVIKTDADNDVLRAENQRLREAVIKAGLHRQSPCVLCGYNGPEYYQPETHKCAALNGEVGDE